MSAFPRRIAFSLIAVAIALALALPPLVGRSGLLAAAGPDSAAAEAYAAEVIRIQAHFDSVLRELRTVSPPDLSPAQRAARNAHIAELEAYRDRGLFPHNHDFVEAWTPYFVDHRGVLCAVAHLLATSGRHDIVERVAKADNNVWVADLAGDREFVQWLDASGLTLAEAARIQVPYVGTPEESGGGSAAANRVNTAVALVAGSLGAATIYWNARSSAPERSRLRAALGYTAGALGLAVAASRMDADGAPLALGIATGTIGLGSAVMATRTLLANRDATPSETAPASAAASSLEPVSLSIAPTVGVRNEGLAPGISFSVRF